MNVNQTEYRFSHGKSARGFGRWGFTFSGHATEAARVWFVPHAMNFSAAKAAACKAARAAGFTSVAVGA